MWNFFKFSRWLHKTACMNLSMLTAGFEKSQESQPSATAVKVESVPNASRWLHPYLQAVCNHTKPRAFKIYKKDGQVVLEYKKWATDKVKMGKTVFQCCCRSIKVTWPSLF